MAPMTPLVFLRWLGVVIGFTAALFVTVFLTFVLYKSQNPPRIDFMIENDAAVRVEKLYLVGCEGKSVDIGPVESKQKIRKTVAGSECGDINIRARFTLTGFPEKESECAYNDSDMKSQEVEVSIKHTVNGEPTLECRSLGWTSYVGAVLGD